MAEPSGGGGTCSSNNEETTASSTKRRRFTTSTPTPQQTLNPPSLPSSSSKHIPFDIIHKILLRLPVKSLLRFRCVCKSWNAIITDPKFAKEQFRSSSMDPTQSSTRNRLIVTFKNGLDELLFRDFSLPSLFNGSIAGHSLRKFPYSKANSLVCCMSGSCHGMLLLRIIAGGRMFLMLWNPATGKLKVSPALRSQPNEVAYGFGYDHPSDTYKVAALFLSRGLWVHDLGTDSWRQIQGFPFWLNVPNLVAHRGGVSGKFVSGTLNWLARDETFNGPWVIFSLDLETETYQRLSPPDCPGNFEYLAVLKGCLCVVSRHNQNSDVWLMRDYGNKDSWTKVLSIPLHDAEFLKCHSYSTSLLCTYDEDDELLLETSRDFVVYNSKSGSFKTTDIQSYIGCVFGQVYTESLISP